MAAEYYNDERLAAARISGTAGVVVFSVGTFATCTRVSKGLYDLGFNSGVSDIEDIPEAEFLSDLADVAWSASFTFPGPRTIRVRTFAGSAPADADFDFKLSRVRIGPLPAPKGVSPWPPAPVPPPSIFALTGQAKKIVQTTDTPFAVVFADQGMSDMPDANYLVMIDGDTNARVLEGSEATTGFTAIGGLEGDTLHLMVVEAT
jgi:hypothetical protein